MENHHNNIEGGEEIPGKIQPSGALIKSESTDGKFPKSELTRKRKISKNVQQNFPVTCDICNHRCQSQKRYEHHKLQHFKTAVFQCSECLRTFKNRNSLTRHIKSSHLGVEQRPQMCPMCHKLVLALPEHLIRHTSRRFACELCPLRFSKASYYRGHLASVHQSVVGTPLHECPICRRLFTRASNCAAHQRRHETNRDQHGHYKPIRPRGRARARFADDTNTKNIAETVSSGNQTGSSTTVASPDQTNSGEPATSSNNNVTEASKIARQWEQVLFSSRATDTSDFDYFLALLAEKTE